MSKDRKTAAAKHARRRIFERYGVWLETKEYDQLNAKIHTRQQAGVVDSKLLYLGRESNTRSHWLIDDQYIAVYHREIKKIVTFLPPEAIDNYLPLGTTKPFLFRD